MNKKNIPSLRNLLLNHKYFWYLATPLILGEILLNFLIIKKINYTEIDWVAYMQEVSGFLNGEYDYIKLKGDTGPLVYPAGFVYIFSILYKITNGGINIRLAQYIFMGLYIVTLFIILNIYKHSRIFPPYGIYLLSISKRLHSIYVLRCFNDPVAVFFTFCAILAILRKRRWLLATILYSLSVSIKMNVLLYAPGLAMVMLRSIGLLNSVMYAAIFIVVQVLLGLPFLLHEPMSYINKAFEFSRVFFYKWTVNWKFLSEEVFLNPTFHKILLVLNIVALLLFAMYKWSGKDNSLVTVIKNGFLGKKEHLSNEYIISTFFTSNFIGIVFSRSLHYQFYSCYYFTLPYLLWKTNIFLPIKLLLLFCIELCWNIYPSTAISSGVLFVCHSILLISLFLAKCDEMDTKQINSRKRMKRN